MPIPFYADDISTVQINRVDVGSRDVADRTEIVQGSVDLSVAAVSEVIYALAMSWKVIQVSLMFSNATSRAITISSVRGAQIVSGRNDRFWISATGAMPQAIILDSGFYTTGALLATELQTQLNANSVFSGLGLTFVVSYNATTRKFSITTSGGTASLKFYENNTFSPVRRRSTAGLATGFTADSSAATTITADSATVIGKQVYYVSLPTSTATSYVNTDEFDMDLDSAFKLAIATGPSVVVDYCIMYQSTREVFAG